MAADPERIPVIVGVGQVNDRPERPEEGRDPGQLMVAALRLADQDAGGGWLAACDSLALVSQISFPHLNPLTDVVADAIGAKPAHRFQTALPNGDSPILLLHRAANRIGAGESRICVVAGGEALRTAAHLARAKAAAEGSDARHDALRDAAHRRKVGYRQSYGLTVPVDVYPLYENACRAAYGQTLDEAQEESAAIWAQFSEVAAANPAAWICTAKSAAEIATPSADNRPIAHPYTKLMVANASVNQGAAFILTSLGEARRRGVADDQLVYVGLGAAAHESDDFLQRDTFAASPSMAVVLQRTLALNGITTADVDHAELYSCFPCVPKMARRVIDWPIDRPATVFGGLTFGGGPIGNYMSHAAASMVEKLRAEPGTGLLFANGGYATHNHAIVLTSAPNPALTFPQQFDFQKEADAARGPVPDLDEDYEGPATIETFTVHYGREGAPRLGTIVARTPDGSRTLAAVMPDDVATIAWLTDGREEPVGATGRIEQGRGPLREWVREH